MAKIRDDWKAFKKNHPDFEKHLTKKMDLGPHLDAFEKAEQDIEQHLRAITQQFNLALTAARGIGAALPVYQKAVKEASKTDKSIEGDFKKVGLDSLKDRLEAMKEITFAAGKLEKVK